MASLSLLPFACKLLDAASGQPLLETTECWDRWALCPEPAGLPLSLYALNQEVSLSTGCIPQDTLASSFSGRMYVLSFVRKSQGGSPSQVKPGTGVWMNMGLVSHIQLQ